MIRIAWRPLRGARWEGRILVPDRSDDDVGMNLNSMGVRFIDQILKRVEARCDLHKVRRRLERVEIPGVASPPRLREDRVRIGRPGVVYHGDDIAMVAQRGVEGVNPESPVLSRGFRSSADRSKWKPG